MVSKHFTRPLLAGALGAAVVTGTAGLVVAVQGPALAAGNSTSTAFALSASGADPAGPLASVSSAGAVQNASVGSFRSTAGTFTATGLAASASAGAGTATANVADLMVAGQDLGSFSADCAQGAVTVHHTGSDGTGRVQVSPGSGGSGSGVAATVTLRGVGGAGETITVASVACAQGSPPPSTTNPPPTTGTVVPPPTNPPTQNPPPTSGTGEPGSGSTTPPPAPAPRPHPGQLGVTG